MMEYATVQFVKSWRQYNTGEVAGFHKNMAENLVSQNIAKYYGESPEEKEEKIVDYENKEVTTNGVPWFTLKKKVKEILGEDPANKEEAISILKEQGYTVK